MCFFEIIKTFCIIYTAKARNIHGYYKGRRLQNKSLHTSMVFVVYKS